VTKSGDQLTNKFLAFRENRLPFTVRVKDPNNDPVGRISFYKEGRQSKGEAQPNPICNLNLALPKDISPEHTYTDKDILAIQAKYSFLREAGYGKFNTIQKADLRISDISNLLGRDWVKVARELDIEDQDINLIITEYPDNVGQQAMVMLRLWLNTSGSDATGNALKQALAACDRQDIIEKCTLQLEEVTDQEEMQVAESQLGQEDGLNGLKANLNGFGGKSSASVLKRDFSMDVSYDEHEAKQEREHMTQISEDAGDVIESAEDQEIKYLAEEKAVHHQAFDKIQESSRTTTTSTASRKESTSLKTESMRVEETTSSSNMTTQESVKKESVSTHSTAQLEEKMEEMRVEQYSTTQQASEYKTEHRQEESMSKESTINEESMLQSTAESKQQASSIHESSVIHQADGTKTVQEVIEGSHMVVESKDGEVVTSEHESFRTDHRETETTTATGTETLLDEADDHVVDHDQKDQVDHKDQEGQPKKGGVKGLQESLLEEHVQEMNEAVTEESVRDDEQDPVCLRKICDSSEELYIDSSEVSSNTNRISLDPRDLGSPQDTGSSPLHQPALVREVSSLSSCGISREPSFIYDTTVEAFSCEGASVDDDIVSNLTEEIEQNESQYRHEGISVIGKIVLDADETSLAEEDSKQISHSASLDQVNSSSGSPSRMDAVFLTAFKDDSDDKDQQRVDIPGRTSRTSVISTEQISTTPEAERYFMKREQSFINKVYKGDLQSLAVEVSDYCSLHTSLSDSDLTVKPCSHYSEAEIEVVDFETCSKSDILSVKPLGASVPTTISSYETIYDKLQLDDNTVGEPPSISNIIGNLGDRFDEVKFVPEHAASFEELFHSSSDGVDNSLEANQSAQQERWSAPSGTVEPPILVADEFTMRFDPVQERIEGHWQDLEILMGDSSTGDSDPPTTTEPTEKQNGTKSKPNVDN